jgi:6-phosphogluconolactonase
MRHDLQVLPDDDAVARAGAEYVAARARSAVADHGRFSFAVSGGRTPWAMFAELTTRDVPWSSVIVYQVDERVAPDDDPDRNLGHLRHALGDAPATIQPMPVDAADLEDAAQRYAHTLPERFDLVHLGLGPDGHTASLVPGDPVLDVVDRDVALTGHEYRGRRRMTLTFAGLRRAEQLLWLVTGAEKAEPLARLVAGSTGIPAGRVSAGGSLVVADVAAASSVPQAQD